MPIVARTDATALIENAAAGGNVRDWVGGPGAFFAEGNFSGATVKLQVRSPNNTWLDVGVDVSLTAPGVGGFDLPPGDIQAVVVGGTAPSGLYVYVRPLYNRRG